MTGSAPASMTSSHHRPQRNHGGWKTARARPSKTKVSPKPPKPLPFYALRLPLYHFWSRGSFEGAQSDSAQSQDIFPPLPPDTTASG